MTNWHIGSQTREAANQRFAARLASIFAQGQADALNPAYDKLRALNEARATELHEQREDIVRGAVELRARNEGIAEAKRAANIHWSNKRSAA